MRSCANDTVFEPFFVDDDNDPFNEFALVDQVEDLEEDTDDVEAGGLIVDTLKVLFIHGPAELSCIGSACAPSKKKPPSSGMSSINTTRPSSPSASFTSRTMAMRFCSLFLAGS